jgi:cell division protein ZapE
VAQGLAREYSLLCLDEFQVTDVADAMILHKLFDALLAEGVTFVITSNRPPEDLYKGGLQREKFLNFVRLVHERMDVLNLNALQDYRLQRIRAMQTVYFSPRNEEADKTLRDTFNQLTNYAARSPVTLEVQGRNLQVHECYGSIAMFTFHELCEKPIGSADYLAIAKRFSVVLLSGIPRLSSEKRNEARRFVTLIDTLYDRHTKLICTADAPPEKLYEEGDGNFEFQRTVSRLVEMQSEGYLTSKHMV